LTHAKAPAWSLLSLLALAKLALHLPVLHRYGYHIDELYFLACGRHLAWGYVDHAPLVPWIARFATTIFGDSLVGLRIFSTLAGVASIVLTGLLAARLGGGRFAQGVAALAMLLAPVYLRTGNMLCIPAFEPLFWVLSYYVLVRIAQEDDARLWPWLGLTAGLGLLNKHSMLFFGFGLVVGLALTPMRKHFRSPWLYAGGALAGLLFLPNLVWQFRHGWPTFHFLLGLNEKVMSGVSTFQFVSGQVLYLQPAAAFLALAGLVYFLRNREARDYRILAWIWIAVFLLLLLAKSKIYYLAPAYPPLLAGGAIAVERFARRRGAIWPQTATLAVMLAFGLILMPVSLPVLSIERTDRYMARVTFGAFENIHELTGDLHAMFGWEERVEAVARVYHALPEAERRQAVIFGPGYGNAGAVDLFGPALGLPGATSLSQTYYLWGLPDHPIETVIGMGWSRETMERIFEEVEVVAEVELENVDPGERQFLVTLGRKPIEPLHEIWRDNRPW
jgi:hypothetical protein